MQLQQILRGGDGNKGARKTERNTTHLPCSCGITNIAGWNIYFGVTDSALLDRSRVYVCGILPLFTHVCLKLVLYQRDVDLMDWSPHPPPTLTRQNNKTKQKNIYMVLCSFLGEFNEFPTVSAFFFFSFFPICSIFNVCWYTSPIIKGASRANS